MQRLKIMLNSRLSLLLLLLTLWFINRSIDIQDGLISKALGHHPHFFHQPKPVADSSSKGNCSSGFCLEDWSQLRAYCSCSYKD